MKAIRVKEFGGPEKLQLEETPNPKAGPGQVVVKIDAAGVNPVDVYMRAGTYPKKPQLPYTPGTDGAGTILSVGEGVQRWTPGARVYLAGSLSGTYAEQSLCEAWAVFPLPENASFAQGASMHVAYATSYRALFHKAQARAAETVLINGASGGAGIAAVQLARAAGLYVVGTASSERGRKLVSEEGAHQTLDHSVPDHFEKALALTGGRGYDVIIEMLANVNLAKDLRILALGGRVVVVGNRGTIEINPRDAMGRDADIRATTLMNTTPEEYRLIHAALGAGLENGTLKPVIGERFPLAEAARAHEAIMKASGALGKIVLIP